MMRKKIIASYLSAGVLMLLPLTAHAAGLGKLSVKSALGQPLNAEIELLAEDQAELAALSARLAGNDAFREARIDPAAVLSSLKFVVDRKPDGRAVLKITSSKPINDPFLDMLIELDWATGRMVREYTVLLDPPGAAAIQAAVPPLEVTPATVNSNAAAAQSRESAAQPKPPSAAEPKTAGAAAATRKSAKTTEKPATDNAEKSTAQTYGPVKRGDTLASIASQTRPDGVNLEQMLVGLYRENRKAFDGNNMNRLKTGKILKLPSREQVAAIPAAEAARDIKLQSADWQSYRQKLAGEVVKATAAPEKSAQAVGKIMPKVEDKAARTQAGKDVLTLSKGEAPATGRQSAAGKDAKLAAATQDKLNALQEDAAAKQKALQDANNRVAALEKNIRDMQRLLDIKSQALAELQNNATKANPNATQAAGARATAPAVPAASARPENPPLQPVAIPKPVAPGPAPADDGGRWYDSISPLYLGGAALAALLLALLAFMMHGKRRRKGLSNFEDSIMAGTDIRANTVYGTQGGGAVNTSNTSFLTDFSQAGLGTIDTHDVDPIAEAEVYMAYGRDAQAEEILKEALTKDPGRHEIHLKLLEIYAARKNLPAFESVATELYAALGGEMTPVWAKAAELGRKLDPNNPLYNNAGEATHATHPSTATDGAAAVVSAAGMATVALASRRRTDTGEADPAYTASEVPHSDFNLDFSHLPSATETAHHDGHASDTLGDSSLDFTPSAEQGIIADAVEKHAAHEDSVFHELDSMLGPDTHDDTHSGTFTHDELSFPDLDFAVHDLGSNTATAPPESGQVDDAGLDFDFDLPETEAPMTASDTAPALDFSDISLDLNDIGDMSQAAGEPDEAFQEAATKLDLARVYQEMGDKENAREILQEVMQEGNATQKEDAQMLLAQMG
ncbi:peptidoglycan-binding protein [Sulfuriferula plumbiphila]|uniref:Peptidoglycan-binding protein n=1 Tax=Sulfuriferula plumbiphila TaxID=171865 RepID=A0A512L7C1_9PROT|nr:FimV/HubP family polar landmark protein [Sulfuriferula plumbiphila]BBP03640.1 peptidoglycan-binding protein [Sulfuriferula plumbiphila]GEP30041.1 peptidoglycan-binding protein [Sulfuriferula plumbiphila]